MKHILTSLLILLSVCVYGQINGSTFGGLLINDTSGTLYKTTLAQNIILINNQKPDTAKVIMLLCDTSKIYIDGDWIITKDTVSINQLSMVSNAVFWSYGYRVYTWNYNIIYYLDDRKVPLVNKVVWMAQTIK